jgi:hypothetical protein
MMQDLSVISLSSSYAPKSPPNAPAVVIFKDLTVQVKQRGGKGRVLLDSISGW